MLNSERNPLLFSIRYIRGNKIQVRGSGDILESTWGAWELTSFPKRYVKLLGRLAMVNDGNK